MSDQQDHISIRSNYYYQVQLVLISFVVLFFELVLIRWVPSYIRYLSYYSNFILLACFLGIGVGLLLSNRRFPLLHLFAPTLFVFIFIVSRVKFELQFQIDETVYFRDSIRFVQSKESALLLPFGFVFITFLMIMISQRMGQLFSKFTPLRAYCLNLSGSLAGIAVFFLMSLMGLSPIWWFIIVSLSILIVNSRSKIWINGVVFFFFILSCIIVFQLQINTYWSPYYKITMHDLPGGGKVLNVNNIGHQSMETLDRKESFYKTPYTYFNNNIYNRALIIGAGCGSDVSFAQHYGVKDITAVDIDPVIVELGRKYHPLKPYADSGVKININDARSFLKNDKQLYDLIIYALPDSLALTSSFANLRLESFLFTLESFEETKSRLTDNGLLVIYNYYREEWLIGKIAGMLQEVFGYPPNVVLFQGSGNAAVFLTGGKLKDLKEPLSTLSGQGVFQPATDEWPFLYIKRPMIPKQFLIALGLVALFAVILISVTAPKATFRTTGFHFFFLGASLMLLETTSIVRFSLLFGSTWMVNSLVFFSILFFVLFAVAISYYIKIQKLWLLYAFLIIFVLAQCTIPLNLFLFDSPLLRFGLVSLLLFTPIFVANLIFAYTFRDEGSMATSSLAWNILGALLGGMFEYSSLIIGYRKLGIFVGIFYFLSFAFLAIDRYRAKQEKV